MKLKKKQAIYLPCFIYYFSLILLVGCSPTTNTLEIPEIIPLPKYEIEKDVLTKKFQSEINFNTLPKRDLVKESSAIGKPDPFSFSDTFGKKIPTFKPIKLLGFLSDGQNKIALVEHSGMIGEIKEGLVGGITTMLVPKGFKVLSVDLDLERLVLSAAGEVYEIQIWE